MNITCDICKQKAVTIHVFTHSTGAEDMLCPVCLGDLTYYMKNYLGIKDVKESVVDGTAEE